jgi:hypothetical protein
MNRFLLALSATAMVFTALPAKAGPNGSTAPGYFPLQASPNRTTEESPHALLGDTSDTNDSGWASHAATKGKLPTQAWQRRPSEGR